MSGATTCCEITTETSFRAVVRACNAHEQPGQTQTESGHNHFPGALTFDYFNLVHLAWEIAPSALIAKSR